MVVVAQLVRASVCGTEGRGFEPHLPPKKKRVRKYSLFFYLILSRLLSGLILILLDLPLLFSSSSYLFLFPHTEDSPVGQYH